MSVSKKIRFEVFKRDSFICQYCGRTPPDIVLEIDHIEPKREKGNDDINNLITACFDCNRGKAHIPLTTIPSSLKENLEALKEKEIQVKEYNRFLHKIEIRLCSDMVDVESVFRKSFLGYSLTDSFKTVSLKRFLKHLPKQEVIDAMQYACMRIKLPEDVIKYFCGICWKKIKGEEHGQNQVSKT